MRLIPQQCGCHYCKGDGDGYGDDNCTDDDGGYVFVSLHSDHAHGHSTGSRSAQNTPKITDSMIGYTHPSLAPSGASSFDHLDPTLLVPAYMDNVLLLVEKIGRRLRKALAGSGKQ